MNMNGCSQKILSAKLLRMKHLQNELTAAQFQLNVSTSAKSYHMIVVEEIFLKMCNHTSFMLLCFMKMG
jgi:hypothetical protein